MRLACFIVSLLVSSTALFLSGTARAQEPAASPAWGAVVFTFGGDGTEVMNAEARDGVSRALSAEGFTVLDEAEVGARVAPARLSTASSVDALRAIAAELGVESVATVAVWTSDGLADSVIVSIAPTAGGRSFSATEHVADSGLAAAAGTATGAALRRRTMAAVVEGGSGASVVTTEGEGPEEHPETEPENDPWAEEDPRDESGPEELFGIIGPGLLLAIGGAGIGLGIYSVLDENCTTRAPMSGDCLLGDGPNVPLGILLIIGGALSAGGAAVWWITGATTTNEPRIDGIVLRDGGLLRLSGAF